MLFSIGVFPDSMVPECISPMRSLKKDKSRVCGWWVEIFFMQSRDARAIKLEQIRIACINIYMRLISSMRWLAAGARWSGKTFVLNCVIQAFLIAWKRKVRRWKGRPMHALIIDELLLLLDLFLLHHRRYMFIADNICYIQFAFHLISSASLAVFVRLATWILSFPSSYKLANHEA